MKSSHSTKVIVGISGGVDSSVAALLLKEQGFRVEGMFMKNWEEDDTNEYCSVKQDLEDARAVCKKLGIPLHTVNFAQEYWKDVFSHFLDELKKGRTPNPDILCNREIKFKQFLNHAIKLGADYIATGHYAGVTSSCEDKAIYEMREAADTGKDQTYFLYTLGQSQLSKTLFPLAKLSKKQIRQIALDAGMLTHNKKDSTGICFIGERPFDNFLNDYLVGTPGNIETPDQQVLGTHQGLIFYTLGQRKGLHIGGVKNAEQAPWFVVAKNIQTNTLVVAQGKHPWGYATKVHMVDISWVTNKEPPINKPLTARVRYRQNKQSCQLIKTDKGFVAHFDEPQFAVTPGQAIVFYQDGACLGGATIDKTNSPGGLVLERSNSPIYTHDTSDSEPTGTTASLKDCVKTNTIKTRTQSQEF